MIDRRRVMTGLAALAAVAALPASAASSVAVRASCTGLVYRSLYRASFDLSPATPFELLLWRFKPVQTWLYQSFGDGLEFENTENTVTPYLFPQFPSLLPFLGITARSYLFLQFPFPAAAWSLGRSARRKRFRQARME
jgi:hypothetical protein